MKNFDNLILKIEKGESIDVENLVALFNNLDERLKQLEKYKMKLDFL